MTYQLNNRSYGLGRGPRVAAIAVGLVFGSTGFVQADGASSADVFGAAVDESVLSNNRAGDDSATNSYNDFLESETNQDVNATSESNSITADSANGGRLSFAGTALQNSRGMTNITANTGPNSVVQGTMALTVIINN